MFKKKGLISDEQLQDALGLQEHKYNELGHAVRLGRITVELGYAEEPDLISAINEHYKLNVATLSDDIEAQIAGKRKGLLKKLPRPRVPIWLQLAVAVTVIVAVTIVSLSYVILARQKEQLYDQTVKIGMVSLNYFVSDSRIPLLEDDILALNTLIKEASSVEGLVYAFIVDTNGEIKAHTNHNEIGKQFTPFAKVQRVVRMGDVDLYNYKLPSDENVLNLTRQVVYRDKTLGAVHVGISIDFIDNLIQKARWSILIVSAFITFFGIMVAMLLGFQFSRPISKLVRATGEISKGNYRYKVDFSRNDELGNLAGAFNEMSDELWKKSLMQDSFGKYVGSEIVELIMSNPESRWLKGQTSPASIVFCDVRGFTSYSETKEPEEIVEKLNDFFEIATQSIARYGGYVDKFIGDAVLAVFGVPLAREDHVEAAVRASWEMQIALLEASKNGNELLARIGIGINAGNVVSGNIGSQAKMEYTVIGDTVNVASRLNGLAGPGEVVVSRSIYEELGGVISVQALPPTKVKGKSEPLQTYKIIDIKEKVEV
ncbi:MAG: HAMP domain-containing protein [Proteobacteria bacterium]|nr:HAMP domain-containing protein [Pseudomonadota bacterium]